MFFIDIINPPLFDLLRLHVTSCLYNMQFNNFYLVYRKKNMVFIRKKLF